MQAWMLHALAALSRSREGARPSESSKRRRSTTSGRSATSSTPTPARCWRSRRTIRHDAAGQDAGRNLENGVKRDDRPDTLHRAQAAHGLTPSDRHRALGRGRPLLALVRWRRRGHGVRAARAPRDRSEEQADRAGDQLADQEPPRRAVEQHARHGHRRAGDERLPAHSGELAADAEYELLVNGSPSRRRSYHRAEVLAPRAASRSIAKLIRDGANEIRIVRKGGNGPTLLRRQARFFSLEEPVRPRATRSSSAASTTSSSAAQRCSRATSTTACRSATATTSSAASASKS